MCKLLSNPVIVFLVDFTVPPETRDFFNPHTVVHFAISMTYKQYIAVS